MNDFFWYSDMNADVAQADMDPLLHYNTYDWQKERDPASNDWVDIVSNATIVELGDGADLGGMLPFPSNNPWNQDISSAPVDPNSALMIATLGNSSMHPDFGTYYNGARNGIPYMVVPEDQQMVPINFYGYPSESDPGPYPISPNTTVEGDGQPADNYSDRHMIVVQRDSSQPNQLGKLYETFLTLKPSETNGQFPNPSQDWAASNGAVFDLNSNALRPAGWTSADAAGLPIFPGLVRYDEVQRAIDDYDAGGEGVIPHALRFTIAPEYAREAWVHPATHHAGYGDADHLIPFGARFRLEADTDISDLPPEIQVIARTLKEYGMFMADNGGNMFLSGAPDERWVPDNLRWIGHLKADDFEIVKMETVMTP